MTYKHKTHSVDSDGKIISNADFDFYIDDVCPVVHQYLIYSRSLLGLFRGSGGPNDYFHNSFELS